LKSGETLDRIAASHNVTVAYLRQINGITPKRKIGAGSMVLVPTSASVTPNLPDMPAPPVTVAKAPKKSVKHSSRNSTRQKASANKTTAASRKIVVAHTAR
jgi:membrane-bound lytic murein transglycosylase D